VGIKITDKKRLEKTLIDQKSEDLIEAIANVVRAAETIVKQIQYGFSPDFTTLEAAVFYYWRREREFLVVEYFKETTTEGRQDMYDIKEVIEGLEMIETIIPSYKYARRRGLTDDEAETLVNWALEQAIIILETIVARDKQSGTNA